jgi:hypothetical protein
MWAQSAAEVGKVLRALSYLGVRLRIGVAPWGAPKDAISEPEGISLDELITAHTAPKRRPMGFTADPAKKS